MYFIVRINNGIKAKKKKEKKKRKAFKLTNDK